MKISDLMIRDVETCTPTDSVHVAAGKMLVRDIGCLPVVNPEGKVAGMITDRDICMAAYLQGKPLADIPVWSVMSNEVYFTNVDATVQTTERIMRVHQVRRLPVLNRVGKLCGLISLNDLTRESEEELTRHVAEVTSEEVMTTIAAVSSPRSTSHTDPDRFQDPFEPSKAH